MSNARKDKEETCTPYLENYVENAAGLPPELTRILTTVRVLDEHSSELEEKIKANVEACLNRPPQYTLKPGTPQHTEIVQLRKSIEDDQRRLCQWAEEKMSLACIMSDLLDMHVLKLDKDLHCLEMELDGISQDSQDEYDAVGAVDQEHYERRRNLEIEAERLDKQRRERAESEARQQLKIEAPPPAPMGTGASPMDTETPASPPSRVLKAPGSSPPPAYVPSPSGHPMQNGRRQNMGLMPSSSSDLSKQQAREGADATAQAIAQEDGMGDEGYGAGDEQAPAPYMPTLPEGMETSASTPQAQGRLLTYADINEGLRGRRAELFWPDDNLWYLIEIHDLDLSNHKAQIMYITGETEELDLTEIVKEGHMSLISV